MNSYPRPPDSDDERDIGRLLEQPPDKNSEKQNRFSIEIIANDRVILTFLSLIGLMLLKAMEAMHIF